MNTNKQFQRGIVAINQRLKFIKRSNRKISKDSERKKKSLWFKISNKRK